MTEFLDRSFRVWRANWVWGEKSNVKNSYYYFRKEFSLKFFENLTVHITADSRYKLFINGHYINFGPIQSQPYCTYFDSYDSTQYLKIGVNTIGIIAFFGGHLQDTRAGLLAEIVNEKNELIEATNGTWKTTRATAWEEKTNEQWINRYAPFQEFYDAQKEPVGWNENGFDDSKWESAFVIRGASGNVIPPSVAPWSIIRKREIPFMAKAPIKINGICNIEECLYLENRFRKEDLSISLSQAGSEIKFTKVQNIDGFEPPRKLMSSDM